MNGPIRLAYWVSLGWLVWMLVAPVQAQPPNIVFILADDLDAAIFDRERALRLMLAERGTTFANHFVSLSLCCPSRTSTLRGQYAQNTGVYTNTLPDGGFGKVVAEGLEGSTIATWLQGAGYRTALIGKYLNGYPDDAPEKSRNYIPPGWSYFVTPNGGTPYSEFNYSLNENGQTVAYGNAAGDYLTDVIATKAIQFIRDAGRRPSEPFFLFITPYAPHLPATPPPRYADALRHRKAPRTLAFDESDVSDKPSWIRALPPLSDYDVKRMNRLYRHRRRSMLGVEDLVRTVLAALRSTAQLERTYVLFASDNGFHMGQHRLRAGKNTAYEEDIRVPLVVIGPGVLAGRVVYEMTANVDFAPTFAEMAGAAVPRYVDGRSFLPLLLGHQPASWRRALLLEHKQGSTSSESSTIATNSLLEPPDPHDLQSAISGDAPDYAGVRTESQLSYIEYVTGERELYNLAKDPAQLNNTYATANPKLRASLSRWLETLRGTAGETLRAAEEAPPP